MNTSFGFSVLRKILHPLDDFLAPGPSWSNIGFQLS
jgi:hypothetical protein